MAHDATLFRNALTDAGFIPSTIYNDKRKADRRLKLWYGNYVFEADHATQKRLEAKLRKAFGNRITGMYFVAAPNQPGYGNDRKALCIRLTH